MLQRPLFFFFNDTATTEIYTLSLHDALPISWARTVPASPPSRRRSWPPPSTRSEEHTSELQSRLHPVCRLLLEKKKANTGMMTRRQSWIVRILSEVLTLKRAPASMHPLAVAA